MTLIMIVGILAIVAILILYTLKKTPKILKIQRMQVIQASPEKLFPYINNPRLIQEWNPFVEGDPNVKLHYTGPAEGVGAQWAWEGSKAGAGKATITECNPNRSVTVRLDFKRPFKVTNYGAYSLNPKGSVTEVTWLIDESALIPRTLSVFMNLDSMIGGQFEKGLQKLKNLVELSS
jgi:hypothetical protein